MVVVLPLPERQLAHVLLAKIASGLCPGVMFTQPVYEEPLYDEPLYEDSENLQQTRYEVSEPDYDERPRHHDNLYDEPKPTAVVKLFVGQIPKEVDEDALRPYFEEFGPTIEVSIIRDYKNKSSKGTNNRMNANDQVCAVFCFRSHLATCLSHSMTT